jgi:hypothetical protein
VEVSVVRDVWRSGVVVLFRKTVMEFAEFGCG